MWEEPWTGGGAAGCGRSRGLGEEPQAGGGAAQWGLYDLSVVIDPPSALVTVCPVARLFTRF